MQASRHSKWPMIGTSETAAGVGRRLYQTAMASIAALSG